MSARLPLSSLKERRCAAIEGVRQTTLTSDQLGLLAIVNHRGAVRAGWEGREVDIVASAHIMAFVLGALEVEGEWVVVDDPNIDVLSEAEQIFLASFEEIAHSGSLVCAMGIVNHYSINHTTGQGRLQGFALKVSRVLGLEYPEDRTTVAEEARCRTTKMLYAAAHPVSKRNML